MVVLRGSCDSDDAGHKVSHRNRGLGRGTYAVAVDVILFVTVEVAVLVEVTFTVEVAVTVAMAVTVETLR